MNKLIPHLRPRLCRQLAMASTHTITTWQRLRRNSKAELWAQLSASNPCTPLEMDPPTVARPARPSEAHQTQAFYAAWSKREQANRKD